MAEPYRRSISELVTRYEFEPGLRDVYVEGDRDRAMFTWFFSCVDCSNAVVYPISGVDVPSELLQRMDVSGNRGRVVALCAELANWLPQDARNIVGAVDKDDTELRDGSLSSRYLITTDFSCIECYALSERTLNKFCMLYLGRVVTANQMSEVLNVAMEVFLLRVAKNILAKSAHWIEEFTRFCMLTGGGAIRFDRKVFMERLVGASGGLLNLSALEASFSELKGKTSDVRQAINGHDLVRILSWLAQKLGVDGSIYNRAPVQRALIACIEFQELMVMPLFQCLASWSGAESRA